MQITVIDAQLVTRRALRLPSWKGSLLRGAIGWALQREAAAAPAPPWPGLVVSGARCAGFCEAVFDPQAAWNDPQATPPWSLQVAPTGQHCDDLHPLPIRLVLFGPWPDWAIELLSEVLQSAARHGLGAQRVPAEVESLTVRKGMAPVLPSVAAGSATLRLTAPCRLKDQGRDLDHLEAAAILRSLLRRWRALHRQLYGHDGPLSMPGDRLHALAEQVDTLRPISSSHQIERWSNRQARSVRMPGVCGEITLAGAALQPFVPLLAWAPLLHIGRQAQFGLGSCIVDWLPTVAAIVRSTQAGRGELSSAESDGAGSPVTRTVPLDAEAAPGGATPGVGNASGSITRCTPWDDPDGT